MNRVVVAGWWSRLRCLVISYPTGSVVVTGRWAAKFGWLAPFRHVVRIPRRRGIGIRRRGITASPWNRGPPGCSVVFPCSGCQGSALSRTFALYQYRGARSSTKPAMSEGLSFRGSCDARSYGRQGWRGSAGHTRRKPRDGSGLDGAWQPRRSMVEPQWPPTRDGAGRGKGQEHQRPPERGRTPPQHQVGVRWPNTGGAPGCNRAAGHRGRGRARLG